MLAPNTVKTRRANSSNSYCLIFFESRNNVNWDTGYALSTIIPSRSSFHFIAAFIGQSVSVSIYPAILSAPRKNVRVSPFCISPAFVHRSPNRYRK